jgi:hypothetical protein
MQTTEIVTCRQQKGYHLGNCSSGERNEMQTLKDYKVVGNCSSGERSDMQTTKRLSSRELQFKGKK